MVTQGVPQIGKYTLSDLKLHKTEDDAWTALNGKVYNMTASTREVRVVSFRFVFVACFCRKPEAQHFFSVLKCDPFLQAQKRLCDVRGAMALVCLVSVRDAISSLTRGVHSIPSSSPDPPLSKIDITLHLYAIVTTHQWVNYEYMLDECLVGFLVPERRDDD
ncbi:hypothetical protein BC936DRAFT_140198 [Jimgerdemannia flammicorona]|uniref:Cytochrome b5 heme-binding domain-containing protein n=1 Tax=Jimgerdemannia flammicorona TaxID=994334 RepID=A0A433AXK0_9FUNG|nr:hypothetical protein BC936DRAFT_140198 [Jimgerdemannia flammicorona]